MGAKKKNRETRRLRELGATLRQARTSSVVSLLPRELPVLDDTDGSTLFLADEQAARDLLRARKVIAIWGARCIIALRAVDARASSPSQLFAGPLPRREGVVDPALPPETRWPAISSFPMLPSVWLKPTSTPQRLEIPLRRRKLFVVPVRPLPLFAWPLAA